MSVSVRRRFEVFKRDDFQCRYCGKRSPEVVLEVDHIVPVCDGGTDDEMNLVTACWGCNRGKAGVPLNEVMTGADPYDKSILLLERERQLKEYNAVLEVVNARIRQDIDDIEKLVQVYGEKAITVGDEAWLRTALQEYPAETIKSAVEIAGSFGKLRDLRYVAGILKNWREQGKV